MTLSDDLKCVLEKISLSAGQAGRVPDSITLVAVSKKQPIALMREYIDLARERHLLVVFGESYVQELKLKRFEFGNGFEFHLIGPLQRNKVRDAVRYADVIESVHSFQILEEIAREAALQNKKQGIFVQVNIGYDPRKSGFAPEEALQAILRAAELSQNISILGLMTITPWYDDPEQARMDFRRMKELRDLLSKQYLDLKGLELKLSISMGMSSDFDIAIQEGADLVRVGSALFGERS